MELTTSALSIIAALSGGMDSSFQLVLTLPGNAERNVVRYDCATGETITVDYINANPTFLALVDNGAGKTIFVNVISADGARYVSGGYEWWTRGQSATFTDVRMPDAPGVECTEFSETP